MPFQVYGNWLAQIDMDCVAVSSGFTVRLSVVALSQPLTSDGVWYTAAAAPPTVTVMPFHVYGNWLAQIDTDCVAVSSGFTVRLSVVALSQPLTSDGVWYTATADPPAVKVMPFQVYGSWLAQIDTDCVAVTSDLTVRLSVVALSQPLTSDGV